MQVHTLRRVVLGAFGMALVLASPRVAQAQEAYPINPPSHVIDPVVCADGVIRGYVQGAEPSTDVSFAVSISRSGGSPSTRTITVKAGPAGRADYTTPIPELARVATVTSSGLTEGSLEPFSISVSTDVSKCLDKASGGGNGNGSGGGLANAGSNIGGFLRAGGFATAVGALVIIAIARRRDELAERHVIL